MERGVPLALALAWRNLWRNPRRALLTASAIGFAVFMLAFVLGIKAGQYAGMIENATHLTNGHLQIQHPDYLADPRLRFVVTDVAQLQQLVARQPNVRAVFPRAQTFALVSVGERSFGAMITAVDPLAEQRWCSLPGLIRQGRYLAKANAQEAVLGSVLASNLGIVPGAEIVIVGSGKDDSVAAVALTVVGLVETGIIDVDRNLVQMPLAVFRDAFSLGDEANALVVVTDDVTHARATAQALAKLRPDLAFRSWQELMPGVVQGIEVNRLASIIFLVILAFMVTFSIVNTFIMMVFERTREFGMLLAIGTRPGQIQRMLQLESLLLCVVGALLGALLAALVTAWLAHSGMPLPIQNSDVFKRFQVPTRIYPQLIAVNFWLPMLGMIVATQVAAFVPGLRLRRLQPVVALRAT